MNTSLNTQEIELLALALRAAKYQAIDVANGFDRSYGPNDGRSVAAWKDAQKKQAEVDALAAKLGVKL